MKTVTPSIVDTGESDEKNEKSLFGLSGIYIR